MISIGDFKLSETELTIKDYPPIKTNVELETWTPADISKIEGVPRKFWNDPDANDIQQAGILGKTLRPLLRSRQFQFMLILPNFFIFFMAAVSGFFGTNDASLSLATVLTWIVWWSFLLLMIAGLSRLWCVICPFGAMGEWAHRFSLWQVGGKRFSLNLSWPRKLKNIWLVNTFFIFFLWMDNVFGFGNSPVLTGYFIVVLVVLDVGIGLLFEKRSFCRYMCPINGFIGLQGLFAGFEMRSKSSQVCRQCRGKWCLNGREDDPNGGYGCPMFLYPGGNDTNKYCILCTECLKSCPNNTMRLGVRPPLKDLWANKSFSFDESFNVVALLGVSSFAPFILIKLVLSVGTFLEDQGMAIRSADVLAKTMLYIGGIAAAFLFVFIFAFIISKAAGSEKPKGMKTYINIFAGAIIPLALTKLIADILDHIVRNGSSVIYVVYNFIMDFPRGSPDVTGVAVVSPVSINNTAIIYGLQAFVLTIGFFSSAFVINKLVKNWEPQKKFSSKSEAKVAGIIMLILTFSVTLFNLWAVSGPATA